MIIKYRIGNNINLLFQFYVHYMPLYYCWCVYQSGDLATCSLLQLKHSPSPQTWLVKRIETHMTPHRFGGIKHLLILVEKYTFVMLQHLIHRSPVPVKSNKIKRNSVKADLIYLAIFFRTSLHKVNLLLGEDLKSQFSAIMNHEGVPSDGVIIGNAMHT